MPELLPRLLRGGLVMSSLLASVVGSSFADTPLNDVQTAASTWARLRAETSRLEKDWAAEKAVLDASISGLNLQAEQLAAERDVLTARTASAREEIATKTAANLATAADIEAAGARIGKLAAQLVALRPALPPRLSAALELPYRSVAAPDLAVAERFRHAMTILNRCNQFNQSFVLAEEILPVAPGTEPRLLEIVYWGLAQAAALDRAHDQAFVGRPVDGVWTWQEQDGLAGDVAELLDVYQDKAPPAFVTLPAQITGGQR